ncbi:hypothetical protein EVAR_68746_1 [Eumeta japonica]|uniref:Uncharacterized protein n=1 Tax=Eumeta variegata TaxID=151549 RepID=A0A4C1ZKL6_EUMVA|nr:hypothetical protein EVAR_68746_1 [Eumeta japonica]
MGSPCFRAHGVSDSHGLKTPRNFKTPAFLARSLCRLCLSGRRHRSSNGAKVMKPFQDTTTVNLRERTLGAESVRELGVQTVQYTGVYHRDERKRGITVAVRCTLRGTTHSNARSPTLQNAARRNTDTQ